MRILYSHLAAFIFTIIAGVICVSLYINGRRIQQSAQSVDKLETEVSTLETKVNQTELSALAATSSAAKEKIFRNELLLQKPGEYVVQLPDLPLPTPTPVAQPVILRPWQQWWKLVFSE